MPSKACGEPNKKMVLTLPALANFGIIARHKSLVAIQALSCRTGRGWAAHFRRYVRESHMLKTITTCILLACFVAAFGCSNAEDDLNSMVMEHNAQKQKFRQKVKTIKPGMSSTEVVQLLGQPGIIRVNRWVYCSHPDTLDKANQTYYISSGSVQLTGGSLVTIYLNSQMLVQKWEWGEK